MYLVQDSLRPLWSCLSDRTSNPTFYKPWRMAENTTCSVCQLLLLLQVISWYVTNWCFLTQPAQSCCDYFWLLWWIYSENGRSAAFLYLFQANIWMFGLCLMQLQWLHLWFIQLCYNYRDLWERQKESTSWPKFAENFRLWGWRNEFGSVSLRMIFQCPDILCNSVCFISVQNSRKEFRLEPK